MLFRSPFSPRICRAARARQARIARKDIGGAREEDVSAAPQEPQAHPWISQAHEDAVWPRDHPSPPPQRPPAADRDDLKEVDRLAPAVAPDRRRERLPRAARVRHRTDYLAIQNRGRRVAGPNLLLFALASPGSATLEGPEGPPGRQSRQGRQGRIGITVSKKVGNAVVRNRVKRWIRECYRRSRPQFPARLDLVVVARPAAAAASHAVVCRELTTLARRLGSP